MGEMTEADRKAFEAWQKSDLYSYCPGTAEWDAWQAAIAHARGKQEPVAWHYLNQYEGYVVSRNHPIKTGEDRWATEIRPATIETLMDDREALVQEVARLQSDISTLRLECASNAMRGKQDPVATQRRRQYESRPGELPQWEQCPKAEADEHFERRAGYTYRHLYAAPPAESEEVARLRADLEAAQADRDALLSALSFKAGPMGDRRETILSEAAARLPAMLKAREKLRDSEGDALLWQCLCAEGGPPVTPLLLTVWKQRKALKKEVARLRAENARLEDEVDSLKSPTWPEWAEQALKILRKHSGNDGYDDRFDGVDLPGELEDHLSELDAEMERLEARAALAASPAPIASQKETDARDNAACLEQKPSKPKVKALGPWRRGYCDDHVTIEQASFGGLYQVRALNGVINLDWPDRSPPSVFGTMEEAKAAAQADYERRILSAIEGDEDE